MQAPDGFHLIRSLEVKGGFADGVKLEFSPELNCVIGPRGAGKTTMLELARFGVNCLPNGTHSPARTSALHRLISANLGSGQLSMEIET